MKIKGTHALMAYGPLLVLSFYATWLAGRISLGYWPRSSLDDPKYIKGFWMWTYDWTAIVMRVGLPVVAVLAAISILRPVVKKLPEWKMRLMEVAIGIVLLAAAVAFMRWDPQNVVEWYFD